jgi:hypothetical protein
LTFSITTTGALPVLSPCLPVEEIVVREMREVSHWEGDHFCHSLENASLMLSRAEQGFRDRLAGNIQQALGIRFSPGPLQSEVKKPSVPDTSISNLFMFNTDLLSFIIPMAIFRPWAEKHLMGRIPYEIEKNLSRLASQWTDGINAAIFGMQRETARWLPPILALAQRGNVRNRACS